MSFCSPGKRKLIFMGAAEKMMIPQATEPKQALTT